MPRPSTLEIFESIIYDEMAETSDPRALGNLYVESGMNHLRMEPGKFKLAAQEIWTGMHGRSGLENLGIIARVGSYIAGGIGDPLTYEHAAALREPRRQDS